MDHFRDADWGGVAFWLFIAALLLAHTWEKVRTNAEKHETLRRIIEKTGTVDEAKLKELFSAPATSDWTAFASGGAYRALRVGGLIVMGAGVAVALASVAMGQFQVMPRVDSVRGASIGAAIAFIGLAVFFSSRYAEPPSNRGNGPGG
jgi:hypothetical protein